MHFDKPLAQLTLDEVIKVHLEQGAHGRSFTTDFYIQSTLWVAWCGMRHTMTNDYTKDIMPFLGLFAMLDQVGNAYSRSGVVAYPDANASGIKKSLYYFAGYGPNDDATKAIYAFRNGLVHNASMGNEKGGKCYVFRYDDSIPTVVGLSATAWDGKAASITPDKLTLINPKLMVDTGDKVFRAINDCHKADTLATNLTIDEIVARYLVLAPRPRE